jgi:hypothetical protein
VGGWTTVSGTPTAYYASPSPSVKKWRLKDTGVAGGNKYTYLIVAANAAGTKSIPTLDSVTIDIPASWGGKEFFAATSVSGFDVTAENVDYVAKKNRIALQWTYEKDVAYKIYRAAATFDPNIVDENTLLAATPVSVGGFTEILDSVHGEIEYGTSGPSYGDTTFTGTAKAYDNDLAFRQSYRYKIVAIKTIDGVPVESKPTYKNLVSYPFNKISYLDVTATANEGIFDPEGQFTVTVSSAKDLRDLGGNVVELYRRIRAPGNTALDEQFETTPVATFTAADVGAGATYTFTGTPDGLTEYYYKAVVKNGTEVLANGTGNFASVTLEPASLASARFTFVNIGSYVHVQIPRNPPYYTNMNLIDLPLQIRYKLNPASWDSTTNVSGWVDIVPTVEHVTTAVPPDVGLEHRIPVAAGAIFPALATTSSYEFQIRIKGSTVSVGAPTVVIP